jgi:hypothetical protein
MSSVKRSALVFEPLSGPAVVMSYLDLKEIEYFNPCQLVVRWLDRSEIIIVGKNLDLLLKKLKAMEVNHICATEAAESAAAIQVEHLSFKMSAARVREHSFLASESLAE